MGIKELLFELWEGLSFIAGITQYVCSKKLINNIKRSFMRILWIIIYSTDGDRIVVHWFATSVAFLTQHCSVASGVQH